MFLCWQVGDIIKTEFCSEIDVQNAKYIRYLYLSASERPVAPSSEGLGAVVGGEDDNAVPVVSVLSQSVGDISDRLVHRGHHGSKLPPGDVGHAAIRIDVGLGDLERSVNCLEKYIYTVHLQWVHFVHLISSFF